MKSKSRSIYISEIDKAIKRLQNNPSNQIIRQKLEELKVELNKRSKKNISLFIGEVNEEKVSKKEAKKFIDFFIEDVIRNENNHITG